MRASLFFLALALICPLCAAQEDVPAQVIEVKYTSQNYPDPFKSILEKEKQPPEKKKIKLDLPHLQVQGIIWKAPVPQAIINNKVVKIGEQIDGIEVLNIGAEGVYVSFNEETYLLKIRNP